MKTLFLIRHAKSSWADPLQEDFDRPLNKRGRTDAPRMARRLKERGIHPDVLLSSPAERAISTGTIIAEKAGYQLPKIHTDKRLYHATDDELLNFVQKLNDSNDRAMIIAHNPGLTEFVNRLNFQPLTDNIPTCGVVCMKLPVSSWKDVTWGKGEVDFYDFPKNKA
jgi:phosphohistidine phosphatase